MIEIPKENLVVGFRYFDEDGVYVEIISVSENSHQVRVIELDGDFQYDSIKRDVPQLEQKPPYSKEYNYPHDEINRMNGY